MNKIIASLIVLLALYANHVQAQSAIQYITEVDPNGEIYRETNQVTTPARCESLRIKNLAKARSLHYSVSKNTYTDPATGISITQACVTDVAKFDPQPHHPLSGVAPTPVAVDCPKLTEKSAVFPIWGQSNAANHGEGRYTATPNVVVYYQGSCYQASDPLVGATGVDGSPWGRLADRLVAAGKYDKVVLVSFGYGGSLIAHWAPGGDRYPGLIANIKSVMDHGYPITAMLFHQGEGDANWKFSADAYKENFLGMINGIRALGVTARIYVAQATICTPHPVDDGDATLLFGPDGYVEKMNDHYHARAAQRQLVNSDSSVGIWAGPNTDAIGPEYRYDGCHLSRRGLEKHADLWFDVLTQ